MVLRGAALDFSDEATRIQMDARLLGPACAPAELLLRFTLAVLMEY